MHNEKCDSQAMRQKKTNTFVQHKINNNCFPNKCGK